VHNQLIKVKHYDFFYSLITPTPTSFQQLEKTASAYQTPQDKTPPPTSLPLSGNIYDTTPPKTFHFSFYLSFI